MNECPLTTFPISQ